MRRLTRREACEVLGVSASRFKELCAGGYFLSARRDQPRQGWSVAECCVLAERNRERPCGVCCAGEPPNEDGRLAHLRLDSLDGPGGVAPVLSPDDARRLLALLGELGGPPLRSAVATLHGSASLELRLNGLTPSELQALGGG